MKAEAAITRPRRIPDTRVHALLYFIAPTGHALKPVDIEALKQFSQLCNVIPVIAKSDTLTPEERSAFKNRIKREL